MAHVTSEQCICPKDCKGFDWHCKACHPDTPPSSKQDVSAALQWLEAGWAASDNRREAAKVAGLIKTQAAEIQQLRRDRDHFQACWNSVSEMRSTGDRLRLRAVFAETVRISDGVASDHIESPMERLQAIFQLTQRKPTQDETSDVTYTKSDVEALLAIALAAKAKVSHDACKHPRAWRTQAVCGICLKEVGEI